MKHFSNMFYTVYLLYCALTTCNSREPDFYSNVVVMDSAWAADDDGDIFLEIMEPESIRYTYKARPAATLGGSFHEQRAENVALVLSDPLNLCDVPTNNVEGSVVVAKRGACTFSTKIINAERKRAVGVIISDDDHEKDMYVEMLKDESDGEINIPAAFVHGIDGRMIIQELQKYETHGIVTIPVNMTHVPLHKRSLPKWNVW